MARYDKYDSLVSGFRAALASSLSLNADGTFGPKGVGLDGNGHVVIGAGNSGIRGLLVKNMPPGALIGGTSLTPITSPGSVAGNVVDVMTHGEIMLGQTNDPVLVAGTAYWADGTTGALAAGGALGAQPGSGSGSTAGSKLIGHTVEAIRLVVHA